MKGGALCARPQNSRFWQEIGCSEWSGSVSLRVQREKRIRLRSRSRPNGHNLASFPSTPQMCQKLQSFKLNGNLGIHHAYMCIYTGAMNSPILLLTGPAAPKKMSARKPKQHLGSKNTRRAEGAAGKNRILTLQKSWFLREMYKRNPGFYREKTPQSQGGVFVYLFCRDLNSKITPQKSGAMTPP